MNRPPIRFSRKYLENLHIEDVSPAEKRRGVNHHFPPEPPPAWRTALAAVKRQLEPDPWPAYLGQELFQPDLGNARQVPFLDLLKRARIYGHVELLAGKKGNTVSDFCGWVYKLDHPNLPSGPGQSMGKFVERYISRKIHYSEHSDWTLIFRDPLTERVEPLVIPSLRFQGMPMRGIPDLVFRHRTTGEVLIVERKASPYPIPSHGWHNLRCQLWAYRHLDLIKDAPRILLAGDIWGTPPNMTRRAIQVWSPDDPEFDAEALLLFQTYGGERV